MFKVFNTPKLAILVVLTILTSLIITTKVEASGGNDWIQGKLRYDYDYIYNAMDYRVWINSLALPSENSTFGWLGVYLHQLEYDQYHQPIKYSGVFSQVGFFTDAGGLHWFVYAETPVTCLSGNVHYSGWGCWGNVGDWGLQLNKSYEVELVTYYPDTFWRARIWSLDANGNQIGHEVAHINYQSYRIYWAEASMEEGYSQDYAPHDLGQFIFWHPQYSNRVSGFNEWDTSTISSEGTDYRNIISAIPSQICYQFYGANINF